MPPGQVVAERSVRQQAAQDARRRAQDFADALDLGPVVLQNLREPHDEDASSRFKLSPQHVQVIGTVEATFTIAE